MVGKIMRKHAPELQVYAFGSRVRGGAKKFSDLDLALVKHDGTSIEPDVIWALREAFSESDLPISVDVVDFATANLEFQDIISDHWVRIFPEPREQDVSS
jgi:predicted nucleotidyltransferase